MRLPSRWGIVLGLLIVAAPSVRAQEQAPQRKLNVLFLISDDLRVETSGYGGPALTPNIDALAKAGVRFDRAYCQYPLCNPSRSSMLTSRYPVETGVVGNSQSVRRIHPDWVSLPQMFKQAGYASLRSGKIFHGGIDDPEGWTEGYGVRDGPGGEGGHNMVIPQMPVPPQPADVLPPLPGDIAQRPTSDRVVILDGNGEGNPDHGVADKAIAYLETYKDQPFFIGCGFAKPHSAPAAPQRFFDLYDVNKIVLPPNFAAWPTVPAGFPKMSIRMLNADLFIGRGASELEAREYTRAYWAATSWMDWNVGRVIAALDRLGLRENTVIVFWGDHGYQLGENGKWSKAGSLFEAGTHVPLIIVAPRAKGNGKATVRVVESIDIMPTLAELCGIKIPESVQGHSLVPLLNDPQAPWDHPAYTVWSENGRTLHGVAVRDEKYRYAEYGPNGEGGAMLIDPAADPHELTNLAKDPKYEDVIKKLSPLVRAHAAKLK